MKLSDKRVSSTRRILVYGAPKSGKTELVSMLSKYYNLLWIDLENGYTTLLKLPEEQKKRIELISLPDSRVYPIAVETVLKLIKGDRHEVCEEHGKCECMLCKRDSKPFTVVELAKTEQDTIVVFDSLTQFSNSAISNITKNQPDDYKMDYGDWGNLKVIVDKLLSQIQAAKYNIICITHEEQVEMEDGKMRLVPVCGSAKSSMNTAKYFDDVVYCEVKNKKHIVGSATTYSLQAVTGSRAGVAIEGNAIPALIDLFRSPAPAVASATAGLQNLKSSLTSKGVI
jgi:hypothetical protein